MRRAVFSDCTSLETITIPESVEYFGIDYIFMYSGISAPVIDNPFKGCSALKSIYMTQKVFDTIEECAKNKKGAALDEDMKKQVVIR